MLEDQTEETAPQARFGSFQEQLVHQFLLDQELVTHTQWQEAIAIQQTERDERAAAAVAYLPRQDAYAIDICSPWTGEIIETIPLPGKLPSAYRPEEWASTGTAHVAVLGSDGRDYGNIGGDDSALCGLLATDEATYLYLGPDDQSFWLARQETFLHEEVPVKEVKNLPIDLYLPHGSRLMFASDRGAGSVHIIDLDERQVKGSLFLRQPGGRKAFNLAMSPDGRKLFVSDNQSAALSIVDLRNLKIKRQALSFGLLSNLAISTDGHWLYLLAHKANGQLELNILDTQNLVQKQAIALIGEPFSNLDDPTDLMAVSADGRSLLVMAYVNQPSLFTPLLNIIDIKKGKTPEFIMRQEEFKPSAIAFAEERPAHWHGNIRSATDVLISLGYLSESELVQAERSLEADKSQLDIVSETSEESIESERRAVENFPVLSQYDLDPALLGLITEEGLRHFQIIPINLLDETLTIAAVDPHNPHVRPLLQEAAKLLSEDALAEIPVNMVLISPEEFDRFMNERYQFILERYLSILTRLKEQQAAAQNPAADLPEGMGAKPVTEDRCPLCRNLLPGDGGPCPICSHSETLPVPNSGNQAVRCAASPGPLANLPEGHLLIADPGNLRVMEIDRSGHIIWQLRSGSADKLHLSSPQSACRLSNGNTLICDAAEERVIEISKSRKLRWELKSRKGRSDLQLQRPIKSLRLLTGNTLIVDQGNHRVFEADGDKIVWQYGITGSVGVTSGRLYSPSDIQRLNTGHTLITDTDNHRVIEVDEHDQVVWQYGNASLKLGSASGAGPNQLNSPGMATRLESGNTLIVDTGNQRVLEISPNRRIVWHYQALAEDDLIVSPNRAIRLKNGNTLIFDHERVIEVLSTGRTLWHCEYASLVYRQDDQMEEDTPDEIEDATKFKDPQLEALAKEAAQQYVQARAELTELELLITDRRENRIIEIDRKKRVTWRFGEMESDGDRHLERPHMAEYLSDGRVLITDTDQHRVFIVFKQTKEILWQYGITGAMGSGYNQLGHPRSATLTPDDTILISDQFSGRIIEVNRAKEIIWQYGGWTAEGTNRLNAPYYAVRQPEGTTLITDWSNHVVIEVDPEGEIIWQYGTYRRAGSQDNQLMYPEYAIRLENGNTLLCDTRNNRVIELDPEGTICWQFGGVRREKGARQALSNPTYARRLENGHTVIIHAGNRQVVEVAGEDEVVWQYHLNAERRPKERGMTLGAT